MLYAEAKEQIFGFECRLWIARARGFVEQEDPRSLRRRKGEGKDRTLRFLQMQMVEYVSWYVPRQVSKEKGVRVEKACVKMEGKGMGGARNALTPAESEDHALSSTSEGRPNASRWEAAFSVLESRQARLAGVP